MSDPRFRHPSKQKKPFFAGSGLVTLERGPAGRLQQQSQ